jgi:tRNA (guanosine-2'-O-)-methyltransferase
LVSHTIDEEHAMLLCSLAAFATALPVRRAFTITSRASTRQITSAISPMKRRRLLLDEATPEDWKLVADTLGKFATGTRVVRLNEVLAKRRGSLHLVLENIADPYNVAAVMRTAEGLGVQHLHLVESVPYGHTSSVTRPVEQPQPRRGSIGNVAMGASRWLTVTRYRSSADCGAALRQLDLAVYASDCPPSEADEKDQRSEQPLRDRFEAVPIDNLDFRAKRGTALVFGNERRGVSRAFIEFADAPFYIPMAGLTQSFNISVAVAMSLYAAIASGQFPEGSLTEEDRYELLGRWLLRDVKAARPLLLKEAGLEFADL